MFARATLLSTAVRPEPGRANYSFKPNPLRGTACVPALRLHAFAATARVGLTQALGGMEREQMTSTNKPSFPIRIVWRDSGDVETYQDEIDLLQNLEDFDSNAPGAKDEATIMDALGRPVILVVRIYEGLCEVSLA